MARGYRIRWVRWALRGDEESFREEEREERRRVRAEWRARVRKGQRLFKKILRRTAPVDTGKLKRSVRVKRVRRGSLIIPGRFGGVRVPGYRLQAEYLWYGRFVAPAGQRGTGKSWAREAEKRVLKELRGSYGR